MNPSKNSSIADPRKYTSRVLQWKTDIKLYSQILKAFKALVSLTCQQSSTTTETFLVAESSKVVKTKASELLLELQKLSIDSNFMSVAYNRLQKFYLLANVDVGKNPRKKSQLSSEDALFLNFLSGIGNLRIPSNPVLLGPITVFGMNKIVLLPLCSGIQNERKTSFTRKRQNCFFVQVFDLEQFFNLKTPKRGYGKKTQYYLLNRLISFV